MFPHRDEAGDLPAAIRDDGRDGVCFDCADAEPDGRTVEEPESFRLYAFGTAPKCGRGGCNGGAEFPEQPHGVPSGVAGERAARRRSAGTARGYGLYTTVERHDAATAATAGPAGCAGSAEEGPVRGLRGL